MSSINALTDNRSVSFSSLQDIANGKYNMGEVVAKKGFFGGIVFDKINNHVTYTEKNDVIIKDTRDNQATNAAVFKAILEHYGAIDGKDAIREIATANLGSISSDIATSGTKPSDAFSRISNPYIREAFKFLMLDDAKDKPLSRDEVKLLLTLLDDWEKNTGRTLKEKGFGDFTLLKKTSENMNRTLADSVLRMGFGFSDRDEINRLKILHTFKFKGEVRGNERQISQLKADVPAMKVGILGRDDQTQLYDVTDNQAAFAVTHPNLRSEFDEPITVEPQLENVPSENTVFAKADKDLVNEIAANAYGSHEGSKGGEGYLGVIGGKVVKCLTHGDERKDIGKMLTPEQKTAVNNMTAELRTKLTALADKLGPGDEADEIMQLLATNQADIDAHHGIDLLSRKTVARVVKLLAKGAPGLFSMEGLKAAKTVEHTSFAAVLARGTRTESEIQKLKEKSLKKIQESVTLADRCVTEKYKVFVELLTNPDRVKAAAAEVDAALKARGLDSAITSCHDVDISTDHPVTNISSQYLKSDQFTGPTQRKIQSQGTPANQTCMQIFADGHFFGGGIGRAFCSQEEATLTDELDPRVAAWMLEKGMIKLSEYNGALGFEYVNLSTADGGYILTDPFSGKNFAFHSMPSLDIPHSYNHDILGNANWTCMAKMVASMQNGKDTPQKAKPEEHTNAFNFIKKFYEVVGTGDDFIMEVQKKRLEAGIEDSAENERLLEDLMEYLIFSQDDEHCNVFLARNDEELKQAVEDYLNFAADQLAFNPSQFKGDARGGYLKTVEVSMAKMYRAAQQLGVTRFIGGPGGTGEFKNAPAAVAEGSAKAFKGQAGGGMVYIQTGGEYETFKEAFVGSDVESSIV